MGFHVQSQIVRLDDNGEGSTTFTGGSRHRPCRLVLVAVSPLLDEVGGNEDGDHEAEGGHNTDYSFDGATSETNFAADTGVASLDDTAVSDAPVVREAVVCSITNDDDSETTYRRVTLVTES